MIEAKHLPSSLQLYKILYNDGSFKLLYGNGGTHAWAQSRQMWPQREIEEVVQLEDSWKQEPQFNETLRFLELEA